MAPRAYWKGYLRLSLVTCPIALYPASTSAEKTQDMIDLASHILDTKAAKFNPKTFKDKYENALKALVKRKASGKTIEAPEETRRQDNVIDLMEALKGSLNRHSKKKAAKRPTPKRRRKAA